jgi:hypothetical protein
VKVASPNRPRPEIRMAMAVKEPEIPAKRSWYL